ncbi:MAG TPA: polysaccharide deacetylase family protein [Gammaproteobacteria bacterium]|nr:polysaccharide deacetylase family protein [Gammaproteobacteria bacterium]
MLAYGPRPKGDGGCGSVGRREIALTFDDGPDPSTTPELLDLLDRRGITATFFVVGKKAERYREIMQQIVAAGHDLGNHSYTHSEPRDTSTAVFLEEVRRTRDLVEEISNRPCRLVRPPKGALTAGKLLGLWREKMTVALWSVDPMDYRMESRQQALEWGVGYSPRGGDIVLLHDNHPWARHIVSTLAENECHADKISYVRLSKWAQ